MLSNAFLRTETPAKAIDKTASTFVLRIGKVGNLRHEFKDLVSS